MLIDKENDDYNENRLRKFKLPVIKSVNHLLKILELDSNDEKMFFYSSNRKKYLYREYTIRKRSGGNRIIEVPNDRIKTIQKAIYKVFLSNFKMSSSCIGYIKNKSIVNNAGPHLGSKTLLKFDIKDFFPSIKLPKVISQFRYFGYGKNVSRYLSYLCVNKRFSLPQGAPTSPMLSNLVCIKMDKRIESYCDKCNLKYTRYADDITISSKEKLSIMKCEKIKDIVYTILEDEGFTPNYKKYKRFINGQLLKVTGITVNDKLGPDKKIIRELDNAIRYISQYNLESHLNKINYKSKIEYRHHLYGLAYYVKMIDEDKGKKYLNLLNKLNI